MKHCYMCIYKDICKEKDADTMRCHMKFDDNYVLADSLAILKNDIRQTIVDIRDNENCANDSIDRMLAAVDYISLKLISDEYEREFKKTKEYIENGKKILHNCFTCKNCRVKDMWGEYDCLKSKNMKFDNGTGCLDDKIDFDCDGWEEDE